MRTKLILSITAPHLISVSGYCLLLICTAITTHKLLFFFLKGEHKLSSDISYISQIPKDQSGNNESTTLLQNNDKKKLGMLILH